MISEQSSVFHALILAQLPMIGKITARKLITECGSIEAVFTEKKRNLLSIEGIKTSVVHSLEHISPEIYAKAENELEFLETNKIQTFIINDENYPKRLRHCSDAPFMFFGKGKMNFNVPKVVAIVGTRKAGSYGTSFTKQLIADFVESDVLVISGLAYGIDTAAHEAAVHHNMQTIGVLGHGFRILYPASNRKLAIQMVKNGGLITEFLSDVGPDAGNFPTRNRIIAGLSDAVVVVEARSEGGALITANLAFSYDRDVFSVPGRVGDVQSEGCNNLIKSNKAALITSAKDVLELMRWDDDKGSKKNRQEKLFFDVSEEEKQIISYIQQQDEMDIDTLSAKINMPISRLASVLLSLECKCYIECLPGKRYKLL